MKYPNAATATRKANSRSRDGGRPRVRILALSMSALLLTLQGCGNDDDPGVLPVADTGLLGASNNSAATACPGLAGFAVAATSIGLPTTGASVTASSLVAANATGNTNGEYCKITGAIKPVDTTAPNILFQLNIPTNWNHRALQLGGGGYNGTVVTGLGLITFAPMTTTPLSQGYATYGSDSGHESTAAQPSADASFALNAEALTNFGYAHIKKTHDVAVAVLNRYFGASVSYKSYFAGGSTGGRESLTAVQRFPADYDGAFVGSPTAVFWGIRMIGFPVGKAAYATANGYLNPAKQALLTQKTTAACDTLDGAADGIVSNVTACRANAAATRASLRCVNGADTGDTCLSDPQLALVDALTAGLTLPYAMANGVTRYSGYNAYEGSDFSVNAATLGLGTNGTLQEPPTTGGNGYLFAQATQWVRYFVTQNPTFPELTFDPLAPGIYQQRVVDLSGIVGAANPDLSAFRARGGKLIMLQGAADTAVSPNATIDYFSNVVSTMSQSTVDGFMRFYLVPGMGHGVGAFVPAWDAMKALDNWVTNGTAPDTLQGTDTVAATAGRGRPLCRYPAFPKYIGTGDINAAASFTCSLT